MRLEGKFFVTQAMHAYDIGLYGSKVPIQRIINCIYWTRSKLKNSAGSIFIKILFCGAKISGAKEFHFVALG